MTPSEAAALLCDLIVASNPDMAQYVRAGEQDRESVYVNLGVPACDAHSFWVDVGATDATICYSDGGHPGPAETHFDWTRGPVEDALRVIAGRVTDVFAGRTLILREALPRLTQLLRRDGAESLLWFVEEGTIARWSRRERRRVIRVWRWEAPSVEVAIQLA